MENSQSSSVQRTSNEKSEENLSQSSSGQRTSNEESEETEPSMELQIVVPGNSWNVEANIRAIGETSIQIYEWWCGLHPLVQIFFVSPLVLYYLQSSIIHQMNNR